MNAKNNLLLIISALLLLTATTVLGERGSASRVRTIEIDAMGNERSLAVNRPTPAPISDGKGLSGDDDDDHDDGKGSSSDDGKGSSGDDDDDDDDDDEGKGKGSGSDDDYHYSFSYDGKGKGSSDDGKGSSDDGKGKGKGKSSKGSKASKGSKGKPTPDGPTRAPSAPSAPTPYEPTTSSPTSADSIAIQAAPYLLLYSPGFPQPSDGDVDTYLEQLTQVTYKYLEDFMVKEFAQTSLTNIDDFVTVITRNLFSSGQPVEVQWRSTGLFNPSSIFLPTSREINELIDSAFTGDNLNNYLDALAGLPSSNPFSDVTRVELEQLSGSGNTRSSSSSDEFMRAGIAAGAAGLVVLVAGLAIMRGRNGSSVDGEADEADNIAPHKDSDDTNTVAGETVNMSLDGSSVAASSWRTPKGFKKYDDDDDDDAEEDDGEFEDEPLDDSDEDVSSRR